LVKYLKIALKIAKDNNFEAEEASLCNELGFFKLQNENYTIAKPYLLRSATIFKKINDHNNYVVVMCHVLYVTVLEGNLNKADKIIKELLGLVKNQQWFGTEQTLYRNIAYRYLVENDSLNHNKWKVKEAEAAYNLLSRRSNNEMSYYRVKYDTEKFKNDAEIAKQGLENETFLLNQKQNQNRALWFFLAIFLLLSGIVIWLFIKKKKLATNLDISNKNFQLLLIESNHRIKNNLQMILSMVNFSSDEVSKSENKALNNISSKIQIISALHKHLYIDVKSEFVSLPLYFEEIIRLYTFIKPNTITVENDLYPLKMNSERIVYFGLILNELLANTIEHNVSEIKNIHLRVKKITNYFVFEYCDYSTHIETKEIGQGVVLLEQLVKRVKGTNFQLDKKTGMYKFHFKDVN
ncbi:MAG: sensor histidine kinase, partial [Polaribacter sp.]|nr:sensor histidine kinase [Polaribacter sp.]